MAAHPTIDIAIEVYIAESQNVNERNFLPPDCYIAGLAQKIVHLNSALAIAWSGGFERAANLFQLLEPLRNIEDIEADFIRSMIDALDEPTKRGLSLIALVARREGQLVTQGVAPFRDYGPVTR